ncbi:hypothetical protein [Pyrobaculum neutrophilum]|uniref:Uncharacterized protein n=1 Tax=Pyrobaculum neutrophilum (strain DSM 2338 / JCM 9278 / NBRC 100436 / V24Sta) TaxID=444157 RepID=B1YDL0_PYRNV|nr:hypothetical protein [Pyrobaculum neutrophilum]ACB39873.1 conserved hypothetical protein [Pyrobaculum neutrophilum V24Sta]
MDKRILLAAALALIAQGQTAAGPAVDYLWLGAKWTQLPKFPGDVGVLSVSFYLSAQYVDVSVSLTPRCPYLVPLESASLPSAGPGVVSVALKASVSALNVTCPVNVEIRATYRATGSGLASGIDRVEYAEVYIPPYPTANVTAAGVAYLGLPSRINLTVSSPYALTGILTLQGQGARVVSPSGPVVVGGRGAAVPVVVVADSPSALLQATIQTRDWLGNPVLLSYAVPLATAPPPPPLLYVSSAALYASRYNRVNLTVVLPVPADGTAVVAASGAVTPQSSVSIPIRGGRGSASLDVYPVSPVVTFTAQVTYQIAGVSKTEQVSASAAVQQAAGGASRLDVRPTRLIAGVANNLTLLVSAPGPFNATVSVSNAAVDKPMPYTFGGVDKAAAGLVVTPLSSQPVAIAVTIYHSQGVDQYTVSLPVSSSSIFTVVPSPSLVKSGGNRTVVVTVINSGDVAVEKAVVTISPATSAVLAPTYTFQIGRLAPLESVQLPISFIAPATYVGAAAFTYGIVYTTELGTAGAAQGTFYLQVLQTPAVNVTNIAVVPQEVEAKRTFYISVTVVNRGFTPVTNLQVEAKPPRGIKPVTAPIYFAGQLDPQQTATIPLSFNATAPGRYEIQLLVSYTDQYGNLYTAPYTVTVAVANATGRTPQAGAQRQTTPPAAYIATAALAAAAAVGYLYLRRRRKASG